MKKINSIVWTKNLAFRLLSLISKRPRRHQDRDGNVFYFNQDNQIHRENGPAIEYVDGAKEWLRNGVHYRDGDLPTKVEDDGSEYWLSAAGNFHREAGPAFRGPPVLDSDGWWEEWYINGYRHREDGPAIMSNTGNKEWWLHGQLHRENGPAIEYPDSRKEWYQNGLHHRENGPATEWVSGKKEWYINGQRHRENGPAIEENSVSAQENIYYLRGKTSDQIKEKVLMNMAQNESLKIKQHLHQEFKAEQYTDKFSDEALNMLGKNSKKRKI